MANTFWGVDYYPEHWPKERWDKDCELMSELGISFVRMAEFSWAKMEPSEGVFRFEWLDDVIERLGERGIKTVLGTPTAAPPAWIIQKNREILPVNSMGIRTEFGGRHHDCQSNSVYRNHVRRFVEAFGRHFKDNQYVVGYQIDNELGNSHDDLCMCDSCADAFRGWLKNKYGTIDKLNAATGSPFWSQDYDSFEQIMPPRYTVAGHNPSMQLNWRRFHSDLIVDFAGEQIDILRRISPDKFITHNCMGFSDTVSYFDLGEHLDFMTHDQYPGGYFAKQPQQDTADLAAFLDVMRSFKKKTYWIMEQQSYITGWETMGRLPKPGQIPLWSMQSIAHGGDAICWFRWRSCAFGTEQYWHGILPHSGIPGRIYYELKAFIKENQSLMEEIEGSMPHPEVAIVFSYDQNYAFRIQPHHKEFSYLDHLMTYYRVLHARNIPVDFVKEGEKLDSYKLVIAPLQYLMNEEKEAWFTNYVKQGGHLILDMRAGVKNMDNVCMTDAPLPGALSKLLGITVPEYDCLTDTNGLVVYEGKKYEIQKWCDLIEDHEATVLSEYAFEFYRGTPAITENIYGEGRAYYVGTQMSEELCDAFLLDVSKKANIESLGSCTPGVEICSRDQDDHTYYFLLNHTGEEAVAKIRGFNELHLKPYEYKILKK